MGNQKKPVKSKKDAVDEVAEATIVLTADEKIAKLESDLRNLEAKFTASLTIIDVQTKQITSIIDSFNKMVGILANPKPDTKKTKK